MANREAVVGTRLTVAIDLMLDAVIIPLTKYVVDPAIPVSLLVGDEQKGSGSESAGCGSVGYAVQIGVSGGSKLLIFVPKRLVR